MVAAAALCAAALLPLAQAQSARTVRRDNVSPSVVVGNVEAATDAGPTVVKVVTVSGAQNTTDKESTTAASPAGRWGQSAIYLPNENLVLFTGGQVSNGSSSGGGALTNDVFALNVSSITSNFTAGSQTPWQKLDVEGLPPHAFAANAVVSDDGSSDQVWLFGGVVDDCKNSAPGWTWSPSAGLNSSWSPIDGKANGARKARAAAMQVPAYLPGQAPTEGTAYMMLGGEDVCGGAGANDNANTRRASSSPQVTADLWTFPAASSSARQSAAQMQTLPVDTSRGAFSVVDYSTVTLAPSANSWTAGTTHGRTMFLGGMTAEQTLAPWDHFWVFDPWTWTWVKWSTTGDVPSGRRGHSSTLLKDGRVLVVGGELEDGSLSNESFLLDPHVQPAKWTKVEYNGKMQAPAKAYHSAVLVDDVLLMGFGAGGASEASDASGEAMAADNQPQSPSSPPPPSFKALAADVSTPPSSSSSLYYLDMSNPDSWSWSDSMDGLMAGRGIGGNAGALAIPTSATAATAAANAAAANAVAGANAVASNAVAGANAAASNAASGADVAASNAVTGANAAASNAVAGASAAAAAAQGTSTPTAQAASGSSDTTNSAAPGDDQSEGKSDAPSSAAAAQSATDAGDGAPVNGSDPASSAAGTASPASNSTPDDGASSSNGGGDGSSNGNGNGDGTRNAASGAVVPNENGGGDSDAASSASPSTAKPSVIVGSLVGAAALAAAIAGLYVYKKRRDARREGMAEEYGSDARDVEKRGGGAVNAPPVSMLWFNNLKRKTTLGGGNAAFDDSTLTAPVTARGGAKRPRPSKISTPFIESLVQDDDDDGHAPRAIPVATRTPNRDRYLDLDQTPPMMAAKELHRLSSCESIESDGNASHLSYPYLSAMHRPSYGQQGAQAGAASRGPNGTPLSNASYSPAFTPSMTQNSPQVPNESPRTRLMEQRQWQQQRERQGSYSNAGMSAAWSPEVAELKSAALADLTPQFGRQSVDGDEDDEEEMATTVAAAPPSSLNAQSNGLRRHSTNSPTVYPWATTPVVGDAQQYHRPSMYYNQQQGSTPSTRAVSMPVDAAAAAAKRNSRRARRSELRVVNRGFGESDINEESDA